MKKETVNVVFAIGVSLFSATLFVAAFFFPALILEQQDHPMALQELASEDCLVFGWFFGPPKMQFGWFANCFYPFAIGLCIAGKFSKGLWVGMLGLLIGMSSLLWFWQEICTNDHGVRFHLYRLAGGFYLWISSLAIPFVYCVWQLLTRKKQPDTA